MTTTKKAFDFLPDIFKTEPNRQFLSATIDQLFSSPNLSKQYGYIGAKYARGTVTSDSFVSEISDTRKNYQLSPAVCIQKPDTKITKDFIQYPGMLNALGFEDNSGIDESALFSQPYYAWEPFVDIDKVVNFANYYWLESGPESVEISSSELSAVSEIVLQPTASGYKVTIDNELQTDLNASFPVVRGGQYTIKVADSGGTWIQGANTFTGYDAAKPNVNTREVFGVSNNGIVAGTISFNVPFADEQNNYDKTGTYSCDLVWTGTLAQLDNRTVLSVKQIDGMDASLCNNKTVLIYNSAEPIQTKFYKITFSGDDENPVINLSQYGSVIPVNKRITVQSGTEYQGKHFFRNTTGIVTLVPYISASLETLYIRDAQNENCVVSLSVVSDSASDVIDIDSDIIGQKQFTSKNGVKFVNGLKVYFTGNVVPVEYKEQSYYVEGVGDSITLVGENSLLVYEAFSKTKQTGYDSDYYDNTPFDGALTLPVDKDYITINRSCTDLNAWSRSNRWFHRSVLEETYKATSSKVALETLYDLTKRATRPIIEFKSNINLFDHATNGRDSVDYLVKSNTKIVINAKTLDVISTRASDDTIRLNSVSGILTDGVIQFGGDTTGTTLLADTPYFVNSVDSINNRVTIKDDSGTVVEMVDASTPLTTLFAQVGTVVLGANFALQTDLNGSLGCFVDVDMATPFSADNSVFDGCSIISTTDTNSTDRLTVFQVRFSQTTQTGQRVITVSQPFSPIVSGDGFMVKFGELAQKQSFYYSSQYGWQLSQTKTTVNQPPLFDVYDANKISFSNTSYYPASNFAGCTLFEFATDASNINDTELGFPLKYNELNGIGEICFNSTFNSDSFTYTPSDTRESIETQVRQGYVIKNKMRHNGWRYGFADSIQYQVFEKTILKKSSSIDIDVVISSQTTGWPVCKLFVNGEFVSPDLYSITRNTIKKRTTISYPFVKNDLVQVKFIATSKSKTSYYEVPSNLSVNAFNVAPTELTMSDLKGHYQTIFENAKLTGSVFGTNTYNNQGDLVKYGSKFVQHSASMVNAGAFLRSNPVSIVDSIEHSSVEYEKIKAVIADLATRTDFSNTTYTDEKLDLIFSQITSVKSESSPFFWSSMLACDTPVVSNQYSINAETSSAEFPLQSVVSYSGGETYSGVLVYLYRENTETGIIEKKLLLKDYEYSTSTSSAIVFITTQLNEGDVVEVNEYSKVYANFVPMTPSKIGVVEHFKPQVFQDSTYLVPTWVMVGHDGSKSRLYGEVIDSEFTDIRDECLFEVEKRIFNQIQTVKTPVLSKLGELMPGFFRVNDSVRQTFFSEYKNHFVNWAGKYRIDFQTQYYSKTNPFTWNYRGSTDKFGNQINQGNWKGIYLWYYDCINPAETPWRMLGYLDKPTWFDTRYGVAPYTKTNDLLWGDLEKGYDYNNGSPVTRTIYARPGLSSIIPVSNSGALLSPIECVIMRYDINKTQKQWEIGDFGPAEYAYLNSSSFKFDLVKIMVKLRPAKFFAYAFDIDAYHFDSVEVGQWVFSKSHLRELSTQEVKYGATGEPQRGFICWLVDYAKQYGIDTTEAFNDIINNLDVRLSHKLAGFSDKSMLKFWVEKSSLNNNGSSLLIPDENYSLILYNNPVQKTIAYSAVIVQRVDSGFKVWGNSQYEASFKTATGFDNGFYEFVTNNGQTIKISQNYSTDKVQSIAYGTEFESVESVCEFLINYGRLLEASGVVFDSIESGKQITWRTMIDEFMLWAQTNWASGAVVQLNPCANRFTIEHPSLIVQPMQIIGKNFVLNQNALPIATKDLCIHRDNHKFQVEPLNPTDVISFAKFELSSIEHAVVFDNETDFGDVINKNENGVRQNKLIASVTKTAEWSGWLDTSGFILNQDTVVEWDQNVQYGAGSIVKYQTNYWTANEIIYPSVEFDFRKWTRTEYGDIQKGLLANSTTRAIESLRYYDADRTNLENSSDKLAFNLIGYVPRDYMASADLDDITQVNVFKNMIGSKGTANAIDLFKNTQLLRGQIDYSMNENWAIKQSEFGACDEVSELEFSLDKSLFTHSPILVSMFNKYPEDSADLNVNCRDLMIASPSQFKTKESTTEVLKHTGLVTDFDSITHKLYSLTDDFDWSEVYQYEYVWVAQRFDSAQKWDVLIPVSISNVNQNIEGDIAITQVSSNKTTNEVNALFNTSFQNTITKGDLVILTDVTQDANIPEITSNVFQVVKTSGTQVKLKALKPITSTATVQNLNLVCMKLESVKYTDQVKDLTLNPNFLQKARIWIDRYNEPQQVVEKQNRFDTENVSYIPTVKNSENFASAVTHNSASIFVSDVSLGQVYRFTPDSLYVSKLSGTVNSFGSKLLLTESGTLFVTDPTNKRVHVYHIHPSAQIVIPEKTQTIQLTYTPSSLAVSADEKWLVIGCEAETKVIVLSKYQDYTRTLVSTSFSVTPKAGNKQLKLVGDVTSQINAGVLVSFSSEPGSKVYPVVSSSYSSGITTARLLDQLERDFVSLGEIYVAETDYIVQSTISNSTQGFGEVVDISDNGEDIIVGASKWDQDSFHSNVGKVFAYSNIRRLFNVRSSGKFQAAIGWTTPSATPLVYLNGVELKTSQFSIVSSDQIVVENVSVGDQIEVIGGKISLAQTIVSADENAVGQRFGQAVCLSTKSSDLFIGAPGKPIDATSSGEVQRFIDVAKTDKTIDVQLVAGNSAFNVVVNNVVVSVPANVTVSQLALIINQAYIQHITASVKDDSTVTISSSGSTLSAKMFGANVEDKFLDFDQYQLYQTLTNPIPYDLDTGFGSQIVDIGNSIVVSAPNSTALKPVEFDWIDDLQFNDCVFDQNATTFIDQVKNIGQVFVYDKVDSDWYQFSQALYDSSISVDNAKFGNTLSATKDQILVGVKNVSSSNGNGLLCQFKSEGTSGWTTIQQQTIQIDYSSIASVELVNPETSEVITELDIFDPVAGMMLKQLVANIDYMSDFDPAGYDNSSLIWGDNQVGQVWVDTSKLRYVNYYSPDLKFASEHWGTTVPNSKLKVSTWVKSIVPPDQYVGQGKVSSNYVIGSKVGNSTQYYYFWVQNSNSIDSDHVLSDSVISEYLENPIGSGIPFIAFLNDHSFAVYNVAGLFNTDTVTVRVNFKSNTDSQKFNEYKIIKTSDTGTITEFFDGVPSKVSENPSGLYLKFIDSISGIDKMGNLVPDSFLLRKQQYGVSFRPRQSMFIDRNAALANIIEFANDVMAKYPLVETRNPTLLFKQGETIVNDDTGDTTTEFNTSDYWTYTDWWESGYSATTKTNVQVKRFENLAKVKNKFDGMVAKVLQNSEGQSEFWVYNSDEWTRIGLVNGTVKINESLFSKSGYGTDVFGDAFDSFPGQETRYIVRSLIEEIFIDDLLAERNKLLQLVFNYANSEAKELGNYIPWLFKTSLIDVVYSAGALEKLPKYQKDNQTFLEGYINEVKPYHCVIKDFEFKYSGNVVYQSTSTDFDIPTQFNETSQSYISPQIVFGESDITDPYTQKLYTDSIWSDFEYSNWSENYDLKLKDLGWQSISYLVKYIGTKDTELYIDNANGLPVAGTLLIDNEQITYTSIDRVNGIVYGLSRGANDTNVSAHVANSEIKFSMPSIMVMHSGRGYSSTPKVKLSYPAQTIQPSKPYYCKATTVNGEVTGIKVSGQGVGVRSLPIVNIDPAFSVSFTSGYVNLGAKTIRVFTETPFETGDLVKFTSTSEGAIAGLVSGQHYWLGVVSSTLNDSTYTQDIALYVWEQDAVNDVHRIDLISVTGTNGFSLSQGAFAICSGKADNVRKIATTLRFDRTSFTSKVSKWESGAYYAGSLENTLKKLGTLASSSSSLFSAVIFDQPTLYPATPTSGSGLQVKVYATEYGGINTENYVVSITNSGTGYKIGDRLVVSGSVIGGANVVNDITISVDDITVIDSETSSGSILAYSYMGIPAKIGTSESVQYESIVPSNIIGTGSGAVVDVTRYDRSVPPANTYLLSSEWSGGLGYEIGDTFTILGSDLGGISPDNDATLEVTNVVSGSGSVSEMTINGAGAVGLRVSGFAKNSTTAGHISVTGITQPTSTTGTIKLQVAYNGGLNPAEIDNEKVYFYNSPESFEDVTHVATSFGSGAKFNVYPPVFDNTQVKQQFAVELAFDEYGVEQSGTNYKAGQILTILGTSVGGTTPENDIQIKVEYTFSGGRIGTFTASGICNNKVSSYFVSVVSDTEVELFKYPSKAGVVSDFDYSIIGQDVLGFVGEFANYSQSLVTYEGKLYKCLTSNNDAVFDYDNWEVIAGGSDGLNATDRIFAYYAPTSGMAGNDLSQLMQGMSYSKPIYLGNPFSSDVGLDVKVQSFKFDQIETNLVDCEFDTVSNRLFVIANNDSQSQLLVATLPEVEWTKTIDLSASTDIGVSSIINTGSEWVVSSITEDSELLSISNPLLSTNWLRSEVSTCSDITQVFEHNGKRFVIGSNISEYESGAWQVAFELDSSLWIEPSFKTIQYVSITGGFEGYLVTGTAKQLPQNDETGFPSDQSVIVIGTIDPESELIIWQQLDSSLLGQETIFETTVFNNKIVACSSNGYIWTSTNPQLWEKIQVIPDTDLVSIASSDSICVVVGSEGTMFVSSDLITWNQITPLTTSNLNKVKYFDAISTFVAIGDDKTILVSSDGITWKNETKIINNKSAYSLIGESFEAGYSPEEMVSGIVKESVAITVDSTPSGDFGGYHSVYEANGFKKVSFRPAIFENVVSFSTQVPCPMLLQVYSENTETNFATLLNTSTYTVNWRNQTITFNEGVFDGLTTIPVVEVFESGGGNQIFKANTLMLPVGIGKEIHVPVQASRVIDCIHPVFRNEVEQVQGTDYELVFTDDGYCKLVFAVSGDPAIDYVAFAIMGKPSADVAEFVTSGVAPQSFTITHGLKEYFSSTYGQVFLQNLDTEQWVETTEWTVLNGVVTITDSSMVENQNVRIKLKDFGVPEIVTSSSNIITLPNSVAQHTSLDSLVIRVDGNETSDFTLSSNRTTVTVNAVGTQYKVYLRLYSLAEPHEYIATSGQTVFDFDYSISSSHASNAIVCKNGLRLYSSDYTLTSGSLVVDSGCSSGDIVTLTTFDNTKNQQLSTLETMSARVVPILRVIASETGVSLEVEKTAHTFSVGNIVLIDGFGNDGVGLTGNEYKISAIATSIGDTLNDTITLQVSSDVGYISLDPTGVVDGASGGFVWLASQFTFNNETVIDTSRLWVTLNGYRLFEPNIKVYENNRIGILAEIVTGDQVIITKASARECPDAVKFRTMIDSTGNEVTYRIPSSTQTWVYSDVEIDDNSITVYDVTRLVKSSVFEISYSGNIELPEVNRTQVVGVQVFNKSTGKWISDVATSLKLIQLMPTVILSSEVSTGDSLMVYAYEGNYVWVNGEMIRFANIDFTTNTISGLSRGTSCTPIRETIPAKSLVYGMLDSNKLDEAYNSITWNTSILDSVDNYGFKMSDPLQLSETFPAKFLTNK